MRLSLTIAAKLAIAYGLFLAPIAQLGRQMVSDSDANIVFAQKEIQGVRYIAAVRAAQDMVVHGNAMSPLIVAIRQNQLSNGAGLDTSAYNDILLAALAGADRMAAANAAADLVRKAADGSNLTLDPDLDSYYTQDALTVKLPTATAHAADVAQAFTNAAGHSLSGPEQVSVGVRIGGLLPLVAGFISDIDNAAKGNPDGSVERTESALAEHLASITQSTLQGLAEHGSATSAQQIVRPLLASLAAAGAANAAEVRHLLEARIAGLRAARNANGSVAIILFLIAVLYVLLVVQRGAVWPLRVLTGTMRQLAGHNLQIAIDGTGRSDEVGDMARAVQVFKDNMIKADALAAREASNIRASERRFRGLVQNTSDMILICTAPGAISYQSPAAATVWDYPADALLGQSLFGMVHPEDQPAALDLSDQLRAAPEHEEGVTRKTELRIRDHDGNWRQAELLGSNLLHDDAIGGLVITVRDITERKAFEQQLTQQAFYDSLTGLPNRVLFHDRFEQALVRASRNKDLVGLLFLDLDNFKLVNDSLGHHVGDELLAEAAARLRSCVRAQDTVARLGGDEFVVVLDLLGSEDDTVPVANAIAHQFGRPFLLDGREIVVSASIGIAVSGTGREDADNLLRDADIAMYRAKSDGRARYVLFRPSMHADAITRLELENDLRHALARDELRVYYQPIVQMESGEFSEVEALVRWEHPTRGLILPDAFIPIAEETGLIVPLGLWVLKQACLQVARWHMQYPSRTPLMLSVNLSPRQFQQPTLANDVAAALRDAGLAAKYLKLEITEGVIMRDADSTIQTLWALKALGIKLAIDDFGTGYSSLSYLKRLPIDVLKIDRSFVSGLGHNQEDNAIVQTIMALAKSLHLVVTGEGIETAEQAALLNGWGCDRGQGYLFSRPLDSKSTGDLLATSAHQLLALT